jgi:hypothetical protein
MDIARTEKGIALPVAIFALVVIGGLVAGGMFFGVQEQRAGLTTLKVQRAFAAAEGTVERTLTQWNSGSYHSLSVGAIVTDTTHRPDGTLLSTNTVRRVNDLIFLIEGAGYGRDSTIAQRVGVLAGLRLIEFQYPAALAIQGQMEIGGSAQIDGNDTPPAGWPSCPTSAPQPAIIMSDSTQLSVSGQCSDLSCLTGNPKIAVDTTISDSSLTNFGDTDWDDLRTMATGLLASGTYSGIGPVIVDGACDTNEPLNWGDPINPSSLCGDYFPFIYATGNLKITGGIGQGVLVVDGDLDVQGGFEFFGPVIVRGRLRTSGTGGHFNGGVTAANVDLEQNTVLGNAVIGYSSCALVRALRATAPAVPLRERAWVNLY